MAKLDGKVALVTGASCRPEVICAHECPSRRVTAVIRATRFGPLDVLPTYARKPKTPARVGPTRRSNFK